MVLCYHFFAVALYAIVVMFRTMSPLLYPIGLLESFAILYKACVVIFPYIFSEMKS